MSHSFIISTTIFLQISEALKKSLSSVPAEAPSLIVQFKSLQYALFVTCFVEVIGGVFFLLTAMYIVRDKLKVDRSIAGKSYFEFILLN